MIPLHSVDDWKDRLGSAVQSEAGRIVFVVGAGLSWDGKAGVWGVSDIIKHVRETYKIESSVAPDAAAYQKVLGDLRARKGSQCVEKTIRHAVLASAKDGGAKSKSVAEVVSGSGLSACRALQNDPAAWKLPGGVLALADLIAAIEARVKANPSSKHPCVLSTNFDGLVECALKQKGVPYKSDAIAGKEFPRGLDEQVSVLHLHGFWLSEPTLHEPAALEARREGLEAALRELLHGAQVFVLGYGGWNDIIFSTATKVLEHQESSSLPDIMWAFHEPESKVRADDANPKSACGHVLASFSNSIAQARTTFYCGIDVHRDLPAVMQTLSPGSAASAAGGATGTPLSAEALRLLEELIAKTPASDCQPFKDLRSTAGAGANLVVVVEMCLDVVGKAKMGLADHARFEEAAWNLITCMAFELMDRIASDPVTKTPALPPNVVVVPVVTSLFVSMLKAHARKATNLRKYLEVRDKEAFVHGRSEIQKTDEWLKWETGSHPQDQDFLFEAMLWKEVFREYSEGNTQYTRACDKKPCDLNCATSDCCRKKLFGVLNIGKRDPRFIMVPDENHARQYRDLATTYPQISFVESSGSAARTMGIDEYGLAHLIAQFIRAAQSKDTP